MKMGRENRKQIIRYDITRPRSRHGRKYSNYKKCISMMMRFICIKQHLSNEFRNPFTTKMKFLKTKVNDETVNYCDKELHLKCAVVK